MPDFHEILKKFRTEKNITQANMSKLLGLSRSTYSLYELGRREPNIDTLKKIASILGVTLDELIGWQSQNLNTNKEINNISNNIVSRPSSAAMSVHFDSDEYTEEELEEIKRFAEFVKSKRKDSNT